VYNNDVWMTALWLVVVDHGLGLDFGWGGMHVSWRQRQVECHCVQQWRVDDCTLAGLVRM